MTHDLRHLPTPPLSALFCCAMLALTPGLASPGHACLELPDNPPDVWVTGDACLDGQLTVVIHDYSTFATSDDYCACALNLPLLFGTVVGAQVVDSTTGISIPGFSFSVDPDTDFGGSPDWQGLATGLISEIDPDLAVDLYFFVVPPKQDPCEESAEQLAGALADPPTPGLVGTGGATADGVPDHHIGITSAESVAIEVDASTSFGLGHSPLGEAILGLDTTGPLVVDNLGSSGMDGVAIELGEAQYQIIELQPLASASEIQDGAFMRFTAIGELDGEPDRTIWSIEIQELNDDFGLSFYPSAVQPTSVRVEARLDGVVVDSAVFDPATPSALVRFQSPLSVVDLVWQRLLEAFTWLILDFPEEVNITGGPPVIADTLVLVAVDPQVAVGSLSSALIETADIPQLTILDEALGMFHLPHRALGQAAFQAQGGQLTVSNLGSSGEDGVSVELDETDFFNFRLAPLVLDTEGETIILDATGSFGGVPDTPLGQATFTRTGGNLEVMTDYGALGASMVRVEVLAVGELVGTTTVPSGAVGVIQGTPPIWDVGKLPPDPPCFLAITGTDFTFVASDATALEGNELRLLAADADGSVDSLSGFSLRTVGVESFVITEASTSPPEMTPLFADGFESGDASQWSAVVP